MPAADRPVKAASTGDLAPRRARGNNRGPVTEPAAAPPLLQLHDVSRALAGRAVLRALALELHRGEVLGLLGVNGAGKSTSLRVIAGVLAPDSGSVRLDGIDLYDAPERARRGIGYLPERAPLHAELTVAEYLGFCARLRGLDRAAARAAVARASRRPGSACWRQPPNSMRRGATCWRASTAPPTPR